MNTNNRPTSGHPGVQIQLLRRLFTKDTSLWTNDADVADSIRNRLGWLDTISFAEKQADRLKTFSDQIRSDGIDRVVLLGMGGSSLAAEVFSQCFADIPGQVRFNVLDTTFPDSITSVTADLTDSRPLFIVSSKSGSTTETKALSQHFWHWAQIRFGDHAGDHFIAITDDRSTLHDLALRRQYRDVFINPSDIGGRYSALSLFGLVPAYLLGIDVTRLLDGAHKVLEESPQAHQAVQMGMFMGEAAQQGRDKLTLTLSSQLNSLGGWIEQLVAESTGKDNKGIVPIIDEPVSAPDQYGPDRLFVDISLRGDDHPIPDLRKRYNQLEQLGHPVQLLHLDDINDLGAEFVRWQVATSIASSVLGINPFDEPDVNTTKVATQKILRESTKADSQGQSEPVSKRSLAQFLKEVKTTDYLAILAYLPYDKQWVESLSQFRLTLARHCNAATCLAFGPRYLHSSGQLHKGGKKNGHFLVLTSNAMKDLPIPGEQYGFQHLINAQAQGDIEVLQRRGQKVLPIDLGHVDRARDLLQQVITSI